MRTDLTRACPACALRVPERAARCPGCGGTELVATAVALKTTEDRRAVVGRRRLDKIVVAYVVSGVAAGLISGGWLLATAEPGEPLAVGLIKGLVGAVIGLFAGLVGTFLSLTPLLLVGKARADRFLDRIGRALVRPATLRVPEDGPAESSPAVLRGRVVGPADTAGLRSPAGTECVAFGVRGNAGRVELDDAAAVPFLVETEDGRRVRVDPSRAVLLGDTSRSRRLDADEAGRLGQDLPAAAGPVRVRIAELALAPGDEVELDGELTTEADPDPEAASSLREAASRLVARGSDERPLRIRRRSR